MSEKEGRVAHLRNSRPVYRTNLDKEDNESLLDYLMKSPKGSPQDSEQSHSTGIKPHPFNMEAASNFEHENVHHAICIETKVASTIGLGLKTEKTEDILDDLCRVTWQDEIEPAISDYWGTGQGYIEVVRDSAMKEITGLYHAYSPDFKYVAEDSYNEWHWIKSARDGGQEKRFARFGDLKGFKERLGKARIIQDDVKYSELIWIPRPSKFSRFYGFPDWLSAVPLIELNQMVVQYNFDFFLNRSVPELIMWVTGGKVNDELWEEIQQSLLSGIGYGNSHKTMAINLEREEMNIGVEKLGSSEQQEGMFGDLTGVLSQHIVTAHGVPPALANILIPGKMGSTNELPNGIMAFQAMKIARTQKHVSRIMKKTLGGKDGVPGLKRNDFKLKTLLEEIDMGEADTVSRMKDELPVAKAKGRDLKAGLKKEMAPVTRALQEGIHELLKSAPEDSPHGIIYRKINDLNLIVDVVEDAA